MRSLTMPRRPRSAALLAASTLALSASAVLSAAPASAATTITDLGTLPGGYSSSARAINLGDTVIGNALNSAGTSRTVYFAGGTVTELASSCCAASLASPLAINDGKEAVGWGRVYSTLSEAAYWDATGTLRALPTFTGGSGSYLKATDINNSGVIVGSDHEATGTAYHGLIWNRTTLSRDLGFMGQADPGLSNATFPQGVNDAGVVVGQAVVGSSNHAFRWVGGTFTDLGLGSALDLNSAGLVVGYAPGQIPVTWTGTTRTNLPALGGGKIAYGHTVSDINSKGDIVGFAPGANGQDTAVLWRAGKAINLGRAGTGTISRAYGINDLGQIVGEGNLVAGGPMHALRWTV